MVEPIRPSRIQEKEIQADLARLEMAEALRTGNVYEVLRKLPAGLTIRDFENYMSDQWRNWKSQIIQDYQVYEGEGAIREPNLQNDFSDHNPNAKMDLAEGKEFLKGMTGSLYKASTVSAEKPAEGAEGEAQAPPSYEEISGMAEGTLSEWENFTNEMWGQIFDTQMMKDYQSKMGEIQKEVQRIIAMAKAGQVDPEYVLIALAKVNVTKNGCLMTWLGKKAFMTNETMSRVANDLRTISPSDPRYFSEMQSAQAKTRDGSFQLQMLVTDMQKVMQDVAGVLEQVHGFMGEINRTRREIITKLTAQ